MSTSVQPSTSDAPTAARSLAPPAGPVSTAQQSAAADVSAAAVVTSGAAAPSPAPKSQLSAAAEQVLLAFFSLQDSLSKDEARMLAQRVRLIVLCVT